MQLLRTPDERFGDLPDYPFPPHYCDVEGIRIHYVDAGPNDGAPIVLLHGEPSWSFLYRTMIPPLVARGYRVIAPDLVGFGRSDKPADRGDHTYANHVRWIATFLATLDLRHISLFCQDWGGLIGLRVAAEDEGRFARIAAANTGLPTGDDRMSPAFFAWRAFSQRVPMRAGRILSLGTASKLSAEVIAAYNAPFPDKTYMAGPLQMPVLVPTAPDDPANAANRAAWQVLRQWRKPFLTLFSDQDPITRGGDRIFQEAIPGAQGQPHATIQNAGHFLQEDQGIELARHLGNFIAMTQ